MKKQLILLLILTILVCGLSGCKTADNSNQTVPSEGSDSTKKSTVDFSKTDADMFTERDLNADYKTDECIQIKLSGTTATADSESVKIDGSTITITENATHIISGSLDNGMLIVNADSTDKLKIVLNNAEINSKTSAALFISSADKVFVTLASGTKNTLSNISTFESINDENIDAAIYSKQDLTFNGSGELNVSSPSGHGICCKDDLLIINGNYTINSSSHGLDANDSVRIKSATININSGKDGLHIENTNDTALGFCYISSGSLNIQAEGDGIDAGSYLQINSGNFDILTGGGSENSTKEASENWGDFMGGRGQTNPMHPTTSAETTENSTSMKALKSQNDMLISNGSFKIDSADDSIHSNANLIISGGNYEINSGDDAIYAEEKLTISDGTVKIIKCYEGLEALNIEVGGGNINLTATDDGINAAGGNDQSGAIGGRDGMFGRQNAPEGHGGPGGATDDSIHQNSSGSIKISDGNLYINSSGDGIDANGSLEISGGSVTIVGPTEGDTATLDYDTSGIISGGTFIGTGAYNMAQSFSDSSQGVIAVAASRQAAETEITISKDGKELFSYKPALPYQTFIYSSPEIISGESYTITIGENSVETKAS